MAIVKVAPHQTFNVDINGSVRVFSGLTADVVEIMDRVVSDYVVAGIILPVQSVTVAAGQTLNVPTSTGTATFPAGTSLLLSADLAAAAKTAGTIN